MLFVHPVVTKAAIKLVACRNVAGKNFLDADFLISCSSSVYKTWVWSVAVPIFIFFTFGIPIFYAFAMYRHVRDDTLEEVREVYGFFFSGFTKHAWWFELWNTIRKSLFTIASVLFAPAGVAMQTWAALVLLLFYVVVFSTTQPYREQYLDRLEMEALSINVVTLLLGIGLFTNENSDQKSETFAICITVCIMLFNILFMLDVVRTLFIHSQYCKCCNKKINDEEITEDEVGNTVIVPVESHAHVYAALKFQNNVRDALNKRLDNKILDEKATHTRIVETIQRNSTQNRNNFVNNIKKRQTSRQNSLHQKVEARKKAKQLNALKNCKIFEDLDEETRNKVVDKMELEMYDSGADICKQGDEAHLLYLIIVGSCQVFVNKEKVAVLNELSVFGESALFGIDGVAKRGGTVTAVNDVQLLSLTKANFDYLVESGALNENCTKKLNQMMAEHVKEDKERSNLPSSPSVAKDTKDHIYFKKKLKKLGRSKLEVIFKQVSPVGDSKSIDRDGVLTILKTLQINSQGKDVVLHELGIFDEKEKDQGAVITIEEFEKKVVSYRHDLFDD